MGENTSAASRVFHRAPDEPNAEGILYFGVELEVECRKGYNQSDIDAVINKHNGDGVWTISNDALTRGREFITQPLSWEYLRTKFDWDAISELTPLATSFDAHGTHNAGIHIHVSQKAFTPDHLFRFMAFHYRNKDIVTKVGGRDTGMGKFTWGGQSPTDEQIKMAATQGVNNYNAGQDRYTCVNLGHNGGGHTAELRYFRSTTRLPRFRGYLQWVKAVYDFTSNPRAQLTGEAITRFIGRHTDRYPDAWAILQDDPDHESELAPGQTRESAFHSGYN